MTTWFVAPFPMKPARWNRQIGRGGSSLAINPNSFPRPTAICRADSLNSAWGTELPGIRPAEQLRDSICSEGLSK
jgi:hypothetical protein